MAKIITTAVLAILAISENFALARPNNGAVRIINGHCMLADGNGEFVETRETRTVITKSGNGNLVCEANVEPPSDGKAKQYNFKNTDGALCKTLAGYTDKWQETVSASGKAKLVCHAKA